MNETPLKVELVSAIVCDDVRREDNGKPILIGVYPTDVVVEKLPANVQFSLWVCVRIDRAGTIPFAFRYIGTKGTPVAELGGDAQIADETAVQFQLPRMPVMLESTGTISVEMKLGDAAWTHINSLEVKLKSDQTTA